MRSASESPRPAVANCNRPRGKQVGKFNVMRFRVAAASCGQWQYSTWSSGFPSASFLQLFGVFVNLVCTANLSPLFGFSSTQKWAVEWKTTKNRFYAQWFHPQGHARISSLKKFPWECEIPSSRETKNDKNCMQTIIFFIFFDWNPTISPFDMLRTNSLRNQSAYWKRFAGENFTLTKNYNCLLF